MQFAANFHGVHQTVPALRWSWALGLIGIMATGVMAQEPISLSGHSAQVYASAFTPDGQWLVTGSFDNTLKLWNPETRTAVRTMEGHTGIVLSVAISPDGSQIASGSADRTIRLWDVPLTKPIKSVVAHEGGISAIDTNREGTQYVTAGKKSVKVWNAVDGNVLFELTNHKSPVTHVSFRKDDQQIATGDESGTVRITSAKDGKELAVLGAHQGALAGAMWAPNNSYLLTAGRDGVLKRWPNNFPPVKTFSGHTAAVRKVVVSPNNTRVASSSDDKTVRIWDFGNPKQLRTLDGHGGKITALAFSNNTVNLATGCEDKLVRWFDINTGKLLRTFPAQAGVITSIAVHPNQQEIAIADDTGVVKIYKTADGEEVRELKGHQGKVTGGCYVPNGAQLITVGQDKTARIWNTSDGKLLRTIETKTPLTCVSAAFNNAWVAVGGEDKIVRTFNIGDGNPLQTYAGHTGKIVDVEFARDSQRLLSSGEDGTARLWDLNKHWELQQFVRSEGTVAAALSTDSRTVVTGGKNNDLSAETLSVQMVQPAHDAGIVTVALRQASDFCATSGPDGNVKLWNAGNLTSFREFPGHEGKVLSIAFSANNQQIATGGEDKTLIVWNVNNAQQQTKISTPAAITELAFSPDSKKLLATGSDLVIRSFDPTPPNPQPAEPVSRPIAQSLTAHTKAISGITFLPDNRTALSISGDGTLKTWSIAAAGETARLSGHGSQIYGLSFSPDGKTLASASADKTVRLWDLEKRSQLKTLSTQDSQVYSVEFSPDGTHILTGGGDKTVRLINMATATEVRKFEGPEYAVYSVAFHPDGKQIAGAGVGLGTERNVYLWNIDRPQPTSVLKGHDDDIYRVTYSPEGDFLLSAGYAGTLNLWKPGDDKPVYSQDLPIVLYSANFRPDGKQLTVSANDGNAYLINLPQLSR